MAEMFVGYSGVMIPAPESRLVLRQGSHQRVRDYVEYIERRAFEKEMHDHDIKEWLMSGLRKDIFQLIPDFLVKKFLCLSWNDLVAAAQDAEWLWCLRSKQPYYHVIDSEKLGNNTKGFIVDSDGYVIVYIDGACSKNGKPDAEAGIGVWFDDAHYLNVSKPLDKKDPPTITVADIKAAIEALDIVKQYGANRVSIRTDSQSLINSVTTWIYKWLANGWVKSNGKPIIHKLQYQELLCAMEDLDVKWVRVKPQRKIFGYTMANEFARRGARRYSIGTKVRSYMVED